MAALLIVVLSAGVSTAADPPRKKVTLSGRGFAAPVTVVFAAPDGYTDDGSGVSWQGPRWKRIIPPSDEGYSSLGFGVHPNFSARSAERAARDKIGSATGWTLVVSGPFVVPHLIAGRKVGTVQGFFLIRHNPDAGYEGWYKAAVAFPLAKGYPILAADFVTTTPSSDTDQRIEEKTPSAWNRRAIYQALYGVALDGNLAAQTIQARVRPTSASPCCSARISGRVTDALGHPLVAVKVTLRKQNASPCCSATTSATGGYTLNVPKSAGTGAFVLSVAAAGASLTKTIRIG